MGSLETAGPFTARTAVLLALLVAVVVAGWGGSPVPPSRDEEAVRRTIQFYFEGHATGNAGIMAKAFHPTANISFVRDDTLVVRSLEQFLGGMSGKPAADEDRRRRRIVQLDVAGDAAVAKLDLDYPEVRFTDYMSLLKVNGEWKIVHKSFHSSPKPAEKG